MPALLLALALLLQAPFASAVVKEDGGGITDHGGGGSFIFRPGNDNKGKALVLWDLYQHDQAVRDDEEGDRLELLPEEQAARGAWISTQKLKSYQFLEQRLEIWKERLPNLVARLQHPQMRMPSIIATDLKIGFLSELAAPYHDRIAVPKDLKVYPGAYFDYPKGLIYIDIDVWNQAGLLSQAGVLLHEQLRDLQRDISFPNNLLQGIVYHILMKHPRDVPRYGFWDRDFHPAQSTRTPRSRPKAPALKRPAPAKAEIVYARRRGILGAQRGIGPLMNIGPHSEIVGDGIQWISPFYCESQLSDFLWMEEDKATLRCIQGDVVGEGRISVVEDVDYPPATWQALLQFSSEGQPVTLRIQGRDKNAAKLLVKLYRQGSQTVVHVDGQAPIKIPLSNPLGFAFYSFSISDNGDFLQMFEPWDQRETITSPLGVVASWKLPVELRALAPYWEIDLTHGTSLRALFSDYKNSPSLFRLRIPLK